MIVMMEKLHSSWIIILNDFLKYLGKIVSLSISLRKVDINAEWYNNLCTVNSNETMTYVMLLAEHLADEFRYTYSERYSSSDEDISSCSSYDKPWFKSQTLMLKFYESFRQKLNFEKLPIPVKWLLWYAS